MFMKKYQLLNTFQWLLMTLFFLFFIMGCDDDEKVREEEEKITIGEDQLAIELDAEVYFCIHQIHSFSLVDSNNQGSGSS